ncbi:raptor N-terminal caspase like domain-containing protein, partial [Piptocephalis cylindrospora]
ARHGFDRILSSIDYLRRPDATQTEYYTEPRHVSWGRPDPVLAKSVSTTMEQQSWRSKERMKTAAVTIAVCLNAGVDPPDVTKTQPCAKLEAGQDPLAHGLNEPKKAVEAVIHALSRQYEIWQPRPRYRLCPDPTAEDLKKGCVYSRRAAKDERVLFHYNGHGVPRPTASGEIWAFNREYTQYIPIGLKELQVWLGAPSILVWDCSSAENIVNKWREFALAREANGGSRAPSARGTPSSSSRSTPQPPPLPHQRLSECIHLAACQAGEQLPTHPFLPADLFTACLTTPIQMALQWFVHQNPTLCIQVMPEQAAQVPGKASDRRTPLGELNWIFTAVTDTIAWTLLDHATFKKLFRQDMMVAALMRNFLLAQRVMASYDCHPISYPALPDATRHPMWSSWDAAVDGCVSQLPSLLTPSAQSTPLYRHSTFFTDQLTAFEVWLRKGGVGGEESPPPQLPVVLQVLLSQVHRLRALHLLSRFLDLGPWAVRQALAVGIFPYVTKLLMSPAVELREELAFIWARILAVDRACQQDLTRDSAHQYFLAGLVAPDASLAPLSRIAHHRAVCAFVLALFCR